VFFRLRERFGIQRGVCQIDGGGRAPTVSALLLTATVLLAGCASSAPSPTPTPTVPPPPRVTATPTWLPRPPADNTATPAPPNVRTIQLNQPIDAIYTPGETREVYIFTSDRARRVGIEFVAQDGAGDLRLEAQFYDETDALIPKITAPIGQPFLRDAWDIPGPGTYTVRVFGSETEARAFELTVFGLPIPEMGGGRLACGESRSGDIVVRGQRDQWLFEGETDEKVTITMLAPGKDGVLELYDPARKLIAHSDDSMQFGADPALEIVLPADGTYTIVARMYADDHAGTYRLMLACTRSED
jgi:hypothetical protein